LCWRLKVLWAVSMCEVLHQGPRETDLLDPTNLVDKVHAVLLSGGSAFGLDAASGVMRWLDERNMGFQTGHGCVPIVPAAVLFDLAMVRDGDNPKVRPDAAAGYAACDDALYQKPLSASEMRSMVPPMSGNVGAGAGAVVGKLFGLNRAMKGGMGHALVRVGPWQVGAMVACDAVGDVIDPLNGQVLAGARTSDGTRLLNTQQALLAGQTAASPPASGTNTSIGAAAADATLNKAQAKRLAMSAHDGFARQDPACSTPPWMAIPCLSRHGHVRRNSAGRHDAANHRHGWKPPALADR
jgi:L-aminopeptidase/D-esterase-like protein